MAKQGARAKAPVSIIKVQFDGDEYQIPKIGAGRNIKKRDKIKVAKLVCKIYATDEYNLMDCLQQCGINSDSTWRKWLSEIKEIEDAYKEAIELKDNKYREGIKRRARSTLEKYLEGFTVQTTERAGLLNPKTGAITATAVKTKEIYIKPSIRAVEYVLNNVDGRNFTKSPEPYKAGNENIPTDIRVEIVGGELPPITREQDIQDV